MYQFRGSRLKPQYSLLDLPVELKRLIYTFCHHPPHFVDQIDRSYEEDLIDMYASHREDDLSAFWPAELYAACQHPRSHLSLFYTCRQLRSELFPVFAEHHVMNISNAFLTTDQPEAVDPIYRLQDLRHVALRFPPNGNVCACSGYGKQSQPHLCIDLCTNVENDVHKFIDAIQSSTDRVRLQSIEFMLPLPCNTTSNAFNQYRALFRSVVQLSEVLSRGYDIKTRNLHRPLIQILWPSNSLKPLRVRVDAVLRASWDRIPDGALILERDCAKCHSMRTPVECHSHGEAWADIDDILSAIDGKRSRTLIYPGVDGPKSWKVVFQPGGGHKYFTHAMVELERRRQAFV